MTTITLDKKISIVDNKRFTDLDSLLYFLDEHNLISKLVEIDFLPKKYLKESFWKECMKSIEEDEFIDITDL